MRWSQRSPWILLAAGIGASLAAGREARAQTPSNQTPSNTNVAAEALFEEGRSLVAAGKVAEACPKFADSERLGPSVATLLNLANCWERVGRTATAWATYREAASAANAAGRKDYLATAQRRADGLAPKLARLIVTVGLLALKRQLGFTTLTPHIGERYEQAGTVVIPLPHPSGASSWVNVPAHRVLLERALALLGAELRALWGTNAMVRSA